MPQTAEAPNVHPGGLVTVAFLKAQLDGGSDHLGIFMPLVLDVLARLPAQSFTTGDIQEALAASHGVAMPQQIVATLLKRATAKKYLSRELGRYKRNPTRDLPSSNVAAEKAQIEEGQRRKLTVESTDAALDMLFRFLEAEQVLLLLGSRPGLGDAADASHRERSVVAEFVHDSVRDDPALLAVLRGMLEGLVLYHAAFLPDLSAASRRFKDLRVVFDSNLIRQALGYEGTATRTLMCETVDVLKASGVQRLVFDKTVHEIQRILAMYEARLATAQGRNSLEPRPMTRHFLTQRYSPSDVREMSALLEREIIAAGFQIMRAPSHVREYTAGEPALAARLAGRDKKDELAHRVVHDVDCVAGILTLRKGHRSASLDDARAVFATASPLVIRNTRLWWEEDEHETGIEPVVHIRALTNLAWLKKPSLCSDFKVRELVALCTAALRPEQATWDRFLRHLDSLEKSKKLSTNERVAVLVSAMSDRLLRRANLRTTIRAISMRSRSTKLWIELPPPTQLMRRNESRRSRVSTRSSWPSWKHRSSQQLSVLMRRKVRQRRRRGGVRW
ncbi:MAG: hypothetical protein A3J28_16575 [Acidobacteria bacterium RIFCSPLOWO2_12_FULL_60_22]|nr:MAG: hypothetical protein A3J28_16575 [Acidobacteria bacterium RIFCSPLOWO2_12_FULL_60_22]